MSGTGGGYYAPGAANTDHVQFAAGAPVAAPAAGIDTYVNTTTGAAFNWDGAAWQPAPVGADFFRSANGTTFPNGVTDYTDSITHNGRVGIGIGASTLVPTDPVAALDVRANVGRSGTDPRTASTSLYATSSLPTIVGATATPATAQIEFRHDNQSQGIGFAYDGIYQTGDAPNAHFTLMARGTGVHRRIWQTPGLAFDDDWTQTTPIAAGHGIDNRIYLSTGTVHAANHYRAYVEGTGPLNVRQQFDITTNGGLAAALRIEPDMAQLGNTTLYVGEQRVNNRKIVLFDAAHTSAHQFYGFGINGNTLRYQVDSSSTGHRFYAASSAATSKALMTLLGNGQSGIGDTTSNSGLDNDPSATSEPLYGTLTVGRNAATTHLVAAVAASQPILSLYRAGTSGVKWGAAASFELGTWDATINSGTQLDIKLANGGTQTPNVTPLSLLSSGIVRLPVAPAAAVAGAQALVRDPATGDVQVQAAGASKRFAGTAVTDAAGNAVFNMAAAAFAAAPIVAATVQAAAGNQFFDIRVTALTAASCTVNLKATTAVNVALLGLTILATPAAVAGVTIHLVAGGGR